MIIFGGRRAYSLGLGEIELGTIAETCFSFGKLTVVGIEGVGTSEII